jgi:hypothetical protein
MSSIQPSLTSQLYVSNIENIDSEYKLPIELWELITQLFVHHAESNGKLGHVIAWAGVCKGTFVLCLKASQMLKTVFICKNLPIFSTLNSSTRAAQPPVLIQVANCSTENQPISSYQKVWPYSHSLYPLAIGPNGTNYYSIHYQLRINWIFIRTTNGIERIIDLREKLEKNYKNTVGYRVNNDGNNGYFLDSLKPIACYPEEDKLIIVTEGWITTWKYNEDEPLLLDAFSPFKELGGCKTRLQWCAYYQKKLYLSGTDFVDIDRSMVTQFVVDLSSQKRTELKGIMHIDKLVVLKDQLCLMTHNNITSNCLQVTIQEEEQEIESQDQGTEKGKKTVYVVNRAEKLFDFKNYHLEAPPPIAPYWLLHIDDRIDILHTTKGCLHMSDIPQPDFGSNPSIFVKDQFLCIFYGAQEFRIIHIPSKKEFTHFFKPILAPYLTRPNTTVTMFDFRMVSSTEVYLDVNFLEKEPPHVGSVTYKLTIPLTANTQFIPEDLLPCLTENSNNQAIASSDDEISTENHNDEDTESSDAAMSDESSSSTSSPISSFMQPSISQSREETPLVAQKPEVQAAKKRFALRSPCISTDHKIYILAAAILALSIIGTALLVAFHPGSVVYQNGGFVLTQPAIITLGGGGALSFVLFAIASCHKSRRTKNHP